MKKEKLFKNIKKELLNYIEKNDIKVLVIGVSGGIDSALCCALANKALEESDVKLIGVSLPITTNKSDEIYRAKLVGEAFCSEFSQVDLENIFHEIKSDFGYFFDGRVNIRSGNIKARLRMMYLYHIASARQGLVLSTDNMTEYLLGFWTLHGDVGDLGMIQELWKTEVYELSDWLINGKELTTVQQQTALQLCIDANPTDGLGVSNSDLDQLIPGWKVDFPTFRTGYEFVDDALKLVLYHEEKQSGAKSKNPGSHYESVRKRYLKTNFKRNNPFNFSRKSLKK